VQCRDPRVAEVIDLMERNSAAPLPIVELARAVNLSASYLTRLFQEETGCSPARFDKDRRLHQARMLLMTSFMTVKEVMAAVGWNDPSHFAREFKRRFGVSPTGCRLQVLPEPRDQDAIPHTKN